MGRGDQERQSLVVKLREVANGSQELSHPNFYLAVRVLGAERQSIVRENVYPRARRTVLITGYRYPKSITMRSCVP